MIQQFLIRQSIALSIALLCLVGASRAQNFSIISAGELQLGTDTILVEGIVSEYFGMNVTGIGAVTLRVRVGTNTVSRPFEFKVDPTRLSSFFIPNDLANLGNVFRPGVRGPVTIEIIDSLGVPAGTSITFDAALPRSNCRKTKTKPAVKCVKADLNKLTKKQQLKFAKAFLDSIRGPIVLEP